MVCRDAHNYQRRLERILKQIQREERISARNKELMLKFHRDLIAQGLSLGRVVRKLFDLKTICIRWLPRSKSLDEAGIDDIKELVAQIETGEYAAETKRDLKVTVRSFYAWLRGKPMPEEVA